MTEHQFCFMTTFDQKGIAGGHAGAHWAKHDFTLALGDDWTDEDFFAALPEGQFAQFAEKT